MKINKSIILGTLLSVSVSQISLSAEIKTNAALMQAMDKLTGRVNKITVPVNSKIAFGDFSLVLRACKKRPAEETPENFAFVDVTDKSFGTEEYNIFRGWMLSSAPGINAIEHPIYDVWLLECIDSEDVSAEILTKEELERRDNLPTKDFIQGQNTKEDTSSKEENIEPKEIKKPIHIKEFINEDRDIEKEISKEDSLVEKDDVIIDEESPENLLDFTKQNNDEVKENIDENPNLESDDISKAIDEEIKQLREL